MPISITSKGLIELWHAGVRISSHTVESKAIESAIAHAEANGNGDYEIRFPNKVVKVSSLAKTVVSFAWLPIAIDFTEGSTLEVDLSSFLDNPESVAVSLSVIGSLPSGLTLAGTVLVYDGLGAAGLVTNAFQASAGGVYVNSEPAIIIINAAPVSTTYLINDGFESATIDPAIYNRSTAGTVTWETSTTHAREGTRSLHTKVIKAGTANFRSEVRIKSPSDAWMSAGSPDYWVGFSFYVPTGSDANQSRTLITQFHTVSPDGGGSPTLGLGMIDNTWYITRKNIGTVMELGAIPRNVWTDVVIRGRIRIDGTGEWDVWVNGTLVWGVRNSNTHWTGEPNFPNLKMGRYAWDWDAATNIDPNGTYQETWHDAIRIATAAPGVDLYAAVAPRGNRLTAI